MAVSTKVGNFSLRTTTGSQAITGVGFQPKAILLWTAREFLLNTDSQVYEYSIGAATGTTSRWAHASYQNNWGDNSATQTSNSLCLLLTRAGLGDIRTVDLTSFDSDGFTLSVTASIESDARTVYYMALGGADISVKAGVFNSPTTTGNQSVTGVGFQPTMLLFAGSAFRTDHVRDDNLHGITLGAAKSTTSRWSTHGGGPVNSVTIEDSIQLTDCCFVKQSNGTVTEKADFVSHNVDGFTINWSTKSATAFEVGYLAIGGTASIGLGAFDQPASTGNQSVSGLGFQPKALAFASNSRVSSSSASVNTNMMFGGATGTSDRGVTSIESQDGVDTKLEPEAVTSSTKCICHIGSAGTVLAEADFVSHDADGFTVNWTTADATARQSLYLAIGEPGAPPSTARRSSLTLLGVG